MIRENVKEDKRAPTCLTHGDYTNGLTMMSICSGVIESYDTARRRQIDGEGIVVKSEPQAWEITHRHWPRRLHQRRAICCSHGKDG